MKTKFCLFLAMTTAVLTLSVAVARAQMGGYGGQKNTGGSSTTTQTAKASDDKGAKPGSSLGGGKFVAIVVSPEEAKKYPPPNGKTTYPNGMDEQVLKAPGTAAHSGFIKSPYSSRVYDCRKIGAGTLLLDDAVKKVFVRP